MLALTLSVGIAAIAGVVAHQFGWHVIAVSVNVYIVSAGFLGVCEVLTSLIKRSDGQEVRPAQTHHTSSSREHTDSRDSGRRPPATSTQLSEPVGKTDESKDRKRLNPKKYF